MLGLPASSGFTRPLPTSLQIFVSNNTQAALAAAQTAIDKFSADASGDNRAAAQNALGILKLQLDEAVRLVAAAPQP